MEFLRINFLTTLLHLLASVTKTFIKKNFTPISRNLRFKKDQIIVQFQKIHLFAAKQIGFVARNQNTISSMN